MSKEKYRPVDQTYFVVVGDWREVLFNGGTVGVSLGYNDNAGAVKDSTERSGQKGRYIEYVFARDEKGKDKAKRFQFTENLRRFMTRITDTDLYGRSQYQFLKNHPMCEGSLNGTYEDDGFGGKIQTGIVFREADDAKDAAVALDAERSVLKAKMSVLELDDDTLIEIANILNHYGPADEMMQLKVIEFAGKKPSQYNELLNAGDRPFRAIIRRGLKENELTKKGSMIMWENHLLGADEDAAVAALARDSKMASSLRDKLGLKEITIKVKPIPPGKKAKVKETEEVKETTTASL